MDLFTNENESCSTIESESIPKTLPPCFEGLRLKKSERDGNFLAREHFFPQCVRHGLKFLPFPVTLIWLFLLRSLVLNPVRNKIMLLLLKVAFPQNHWTINFTWTITDLKFSPELKFFLSRSNFYSGKSSFCGFFLCIFTHHISIFFTLNFAF